jgi:hypothetical protein
MRLLGFGHRLHPFDSAALRAAPLRVSGFKMGSEVTRGRLRVLMRWFAVRHDVRDLHSTSFLAAGAAASVETSSAASSGLSFSSTTAASFGFNSRNS